MIQRKNFDEFADEIKKIFTEDIVTVYRDIECIKIEFFNISSCATRTEMDRFIDLKKKYSFSFSIHKSIEHDVPEIWIDFNSQPVKPKKPVKPKIPNDIPIDMQVGC